VRPSSGAVAKKAKSTVSVLCNVKGVAVETGAARFPAEFRLNPNASRVGAMFKEKTREVLSLIRPLEGKDALRAYWSGKPVRFGSFDLPLSLFELVTTPEAGFEVAEKGGLFVALPKERDQKLVAEGLVRDLARRLQALRKEKGFKPTALLGSASISGLEAEDVELLEPLREEIAVLVRVKKVQLIEGERKGKGWSESDLDGRPINLEVH